MSASDRSQDAGHKIHGVLDEVFGKLLQDGVGQFDQLFSEMNSRFDRMQSEIAGMQQHIARLEGERDSVLQKHSDLERLIDDKIEQVEWRADQKIQAHMQGVNEQKQRDLCKRVLHRLRMKWVYLTFNSWKGVWADVRAEKQAIQTAAMKFFRTSMVYAFNTWRAKTNQGRKITAKMSMEANYERINEIEKAMGLEVEQRHHEFAQVNVVLKQLELLIDSRDQAEAQRRHVEIDRKLRRTMVMMKMGTLLNCFTAWKESCQEAKDKQQLLNKVRNMLTKKNVTLCFGAWKKWTEVKRDDKDRDARRATAEQNFKKICDLENIVEQNKVNMEGLIATTAEDVQNAIKQGLTLAEAKQKKDLAMKHRQNVIMRLLQKCLVQTFDVWKAQWVEKRDLERKLKKAVALFSKMPMVQCFRAWQIHWKGGKSIKHDMTVRANFERLGAVEAALQAETEQRHYEAEQVSKVLTHLETVFGNTCESLHQKQQAHMKALRESGLRSIMFRMQSNVLGQAFQGFRLGVEAVRKAKVEAARERNVMEKMLFLLNGNKKGQAFMTWKQAVERIKNADAMQTIYSLKDLSSKVDKHDSMFITFAKTFRLIPENVSEMMQGQSPHKGGGVEEGTPPRGA